MKDKTTEKELVNDIRSSLSLFDQPLLISTSKNDALEDACVRYLKYKGYSIKDPNDYRYTIDKLDDLIKFFYTLLDSKHPEYLNVYRNMSKDRKIASLFVKNRMEATGSSYNIALKECAAIIHTVFLKEAEFKFNTDIYFAMFGQAKLSWVTEKAVSLINKDMKKLKKVQHEKELERIELEQQGEYELGFTDIDAILERMGGDN